MADTTHKIVADLEVCKEEPKQKVIQLTSPSDEAFTADVGEHHKFDLTCSLARKCMETINEFSETDDTTLEGYFKGTLPEISSYIDERCKDYLQFRLGSALKELHDLDEDKYLRLDTKKALGIDTTKPIQDYYPHIPKDATFVINQCYGDVPRTTLVTNNHLYDFENYNEKDLSINVNKRMCEEICIGSLKKLGATETNRKLVIDGNKLPTKVSVYYTDKSLKETERLLEDCIPDEEDKSDDNSLGFWFYAGVLLIFLLSASAPFLLGRENRSKRY